MLNFLDAALIGELALFITAAMQLLKSKKGIPGSVIAPLSGLVGIVSALIWYGVTGGLHDSEKLFSIDWPNWFRAITNGTIAAVSSNSAYIAQKNLPGFNILPTASELREAAMKEELEKQELVVEAVSEGIPPEKAKDTIGIPKNDPPPNAVLEEIQPTVPAPEEDRV